jgi:hypothetical protein
MPAQTTTRLSKGLFYTVLVMLLVAIVLQIVGTVKHASLTSGADSCDCVNTDLGNRSCPFTPDTKSALSLNGYLNYIILAILVITTGIVIARNFLLG